MVAIRRDVSFSGTSVGMLGVGVAALVVASCLCAIIYVQYRKTQLRQTQMVADAKRAQIGAPVLQRAPNSFAETKVDMSMVTRDSRLQSLPSHRIASSSRSYQASLPQWHLSSSESGSSSSSGPAPTSSSDRTRRSCEKGSDHSLATLASSSRGQSRIPPIPRRPLLPATGPSAPSFAREKRVSRAAVPSALLRGLGDLPQLPAPGSGRRPSKADSTLNSEASHDQAVDFAIGITSRSEAAHADRSSMPSSSTPRRDTTSTTAELICHSKRTTGGPAPVTVNYFSQIGRRALASNGNQSAGVPARDITTQRIVSDPRVPPGSNPHKKPDYTLPPLPSLVKKEQSSSSLSAPVDFRPLSLGLRNSSQDSGLISATLFGSMSHLLLFDNSTDAEKAQSTIKIDESKDERSGDLSGANSSSLQSIIKSLSSSQDYHDASQSTGAATTIDDSSRDIYEDASEIVTRKGDYPKEKMDRVSLEKPIRIIPRIIYSDEKTPAPFQTPHHYTVYPDKINVEQTMDEDQRSSRAVTPDLSQILDAPLPPTTLPVLPVGSNKSSFASTLKAKWSLTRNRSTSSPAPPNKEAIPAGTVEKERQTPTKQISASSSPRIGQTKGGRSSMPNSTAAKPNPPNQAAVTWSADTKETSAPAFRIAPGPKVSSTNFPLGLALSDEHGRNMDHQMAHSPMSVGFDSNSPIMSPDLWEERTEIGHQDMFTSKELQRKVVDNDNRKSRYEERLGTPPMQHTASPRAVTLSHLPVKEGQMPTMVGSDWTLNRQEQTKSVHRRSIASSICDTIDTCMTGASERFAVYDGEKAQIQRARLLQTIQKNKSNDKDQSAEVEQKGFVSHTAISPTSVDRNSLKAAQTNDGHRQGSIKRPVHLSIQPARIGDTRAAAAPHSAPLTPPLTPGDHTPTGRRQESRTLAAAAPVEERTPTMNDFQDARFTRLRPLSLAIQQQQQQQQYQQQQAMQSASAAITRFMTSSGSISLHRSQYPSISSSSRTSGSMTPIPSASSSNTSISQISSSSPARKSISLLASTASPNTTRVSFAPKNIILRSGATPIGILPTLSADSSPSFITSSMATRGTSNLNTSGYLRQTQSSMSHSYSHRSSLDDDDDVSALPYYTPDPTDMYSPSRRVAAR